MKKIRFFAALFLTICLLGSATAFAEGTEGWQTVENGFYYQYADGTTAKNTWIGAGEWRYYVDATGRALEGLQDVNGQTYYFKPYPWCNVQYEWQTINGGFYYFGDDGVLRKSCWIGGGEWKYYVDETGRALEGLRTVDGKTYYFKPYPWCNVQYGKQIVDGQELTFDETGALVSGSTPSVPDTSIKPEPSPAPLPELFDFWRDENGGLYYYEKGALVRNSWIGTGEWRYYVDHNGRAVEGFQRINNETYYFKPYPMCNMQYDWQSINGALYYFGTDGKLARSSWIGFGEWKYYVDGTGRAVEGLQTIQGKTYYFKEFPWCNVQYGQQVVNGTTMNFDTTTGARIEPGSNNKPSTSTPTPPVNTGFLEHGIDVSEYQGIIDWNQVAQSGVDYAIIRAISFRGGTMHIDPYFVQNVYGARQAGLKIGAYHYTYAIDEGEVVEEITMLTEALAMVEANGVRFDYPIYVDIESNTYTNSLTTQRRTDLMIYAQTLLRQKGYYGALYTFTNYAKNQLDMARLQDYDLWIADYNSRPGYTGLYNAWQYTSRGQVPGIAGNVDRNYCYKDYATLIRNGGYNHY